MNELALSASDLLAEAVPSPPPCKVILTLSRGRGQASGELVDLPKATQSVNVELGPRPGPSDFACGTILLLPGSFVQN